MSTTSPRRTGRADPGGARVTPRDALILRFVGHAAVVTIAMVAALLDMSPEMARRRLHVLHSLGYVAKTVTSMEAPTRYTLTPTAVPIVDRLFAPPEGGWRVLRSIERMNLAHHDGQVALHIAFATAGIRSTEWRLERYYYEYEVRRRLGAPADALIPDAVAVLAADDGRRWAVACEVDRSENPSYLVERKLLPYTDSHAAGGPLMGCASWSVAWLCSSVRRRNRLAEAAWQGGVPDGLHVFAAEAEIDGRSILTPAWWSPKVVDGVPTLTTCGLVGTVVTDRSGRNNVQTSKTTILQADPASAKTQCFTPGDAR